MRAAWLSCACGVLGVRLCLCRACAVLMLTQGVPVQVERLLEQIKEYQARERQHKEQEAKFQSEASLLPLPPPSLSLPLSLSKKSKKSQA